LSPLSLFQERIQYMMTPTTMTAAVESTDADLVARSLAGDRDAFSQIVARYQILICSLAYSRLGHLGQSEDVAQETFITAWKHLRLLREPAKLRAWLCGIVRNRAYKSLERERREPAHDADALTALDESPADEALPSEQTIGREEAAILWRSLEKIPELYREPLILFYREHESIENVAKELELSEDAVKQRLSRGRKLLQEEVLAFVENTLRQTAPKPAFSRAVLAALPMAGPATIAGGGAAGKTAAAAKSGILVASLSPLLGILSGIAAHWLIARNAPTASERQVKKVAFTSLWIFVLAWCVGGQLAMRALAKHLQWSDQTFFTVMAGFWWFYGIVIATFGVVTFRRVLAIRQQSEAAAGMPQPPPTSVQPVKRLMVIAGVHLACFWWLIDLARQGDDPSWAVGIIGAMILLAVWNFFQLPGKTGTAAARAVARHLVVIWAVILVILNCRLETWEATLHNLDLTQMHRLLPPWTIPSLTLAMLIWAGALIKITSPRRTANASGQS
jgi:RNA polymerase sigma factor (sigma-70 family)